MTAKYVHKVSLLVLNTYTCLHFKGTNTIRKLYVSLKLTANVHQIPHECKLVGSRDQNDNDRQESSESKRKIYFRWTVYNLNSNIVYSFVF